MAKNKEKQSDTMIMEIQKLKLNLQMIKNKENKSNTIIMEI